MNPSPGVSRISRGAPGAAGGAGVVGGSVGATVKVQVAACSAAATALPAASGESNTTSGHSNVVPLTHGGMSRTTRRSSRPAVSSSRSPAARPMPTGSSANRRAIAKEPVECLGNLTARHAGDVMTAVREQDHGGSLGVVGEMRCALFHRFDVVRVDADGVLEVGAQAPAIGRADGPQAVSEGRDGLRVVQQMQVRATLDIPRFRRELDKRDRGVARDEIGGQCIDPVGHPLERTREARAVPGVVEDRRREVEAEDDVGAVGRCFSSRSRGTPPDARSRPAMAMAMAKKRKAR